MNKINTQNTTVCLLASDTGWEKWCKDVKCRFWKCSVLCNRFTYIWVLNEEVFAGAVPLHRQHIALLLLTLPHQEVPVVLQQLLDLQSGDGSVVPVLLSQRTVHVLHRRLDLNCLEERGRNGIFAPADGNNKTQEGGVQRDSAEIRWRHFKRESNHSTVPPPFLPPGQQSDESLKRKKELTHKKIVFFLVQIY